MKINTHKRLLYFAIVVIPIIITAILFFYYQVNREEAKNKAHAEWVASIHQRQWDSYINKIVSSLNILSLSIQTNTDSAEEINNLLKKCLRMSIFMVVYSCLIVQVKQLLVLTIRMIRSISLKRII